jgi:hypothetical protein
MPTLTPEVMAEYPLASGRELQIDAIANNDIEQALLQIQNRKPKYDRFYRYYAGDHRLVYATDKFKNVFGHLFYAIADNLSQLVVDSISDRLQVNGFNVEEGGKDSDDDAWEVWQMNRMDERAGLVHREALRAGDAYALVWPNKDGEPVIWPQMAHQCTVRYDDEEPDRLLWAAKVWMTEKRVRLNLYYPERIEKYITKGSVSDIPGKAQAFERLPDEPRVENPWGEVPVIHFANNAWLSSFGESELCNVIPLQDALNKSLCDMLVAMEFNAFAQRWATGIELEIDPVTGKEKEPFRPGADRLWTTANDEARFGEFSQSRLEEFLKVQESLRAEIARVTGLPQHYVVNISGNYPSGESLRTAEARFVAKVKARQQSFGNAWENVLRLALSMKRGRIDRLATQWQDAAPMSATEHLNQLILKQGIGVSEMQLQAEAGYGEEDIKRMQTERADELDTATRRFNAGLTPGGISG